jgi:hypothetical protein
VQLGEVDHQRFVEKYPGTLCYGFGVFFRIGFIRLHKIDLHAFKVLTMSKLAVAAKWPKYKVGHFNFQYICVIRILIAGLGLYNI